LRPADVLALEVEADSARPQYRDFVSRFEQVCEAEADITSIYVLRPIEKPGYMKFAADYVRKGRPVGAAKVGQEYDATRAHRMFEALHHPTVEQELYVDEWGETLSGYAPVGPIPAGGRAVAMVGVDVSSARIQRLKREVLGVTLLFYGIATVLIGLAALLVGRNVRGPLSSIIDATSQIADGRFDVRAGLRREDEFGILGRHFDHMAAGLQERERIRDTFGRYVSPDVARRILATREHELMDGEEREVTVLLSDLRNYSTISEFLPPAQVVTLLNRYLAVMNDVIDAHGGTIIEFLGDGILCVFGAPGDQPDHAARAVACAGEMRAGLGVLNAALEREGIARAWKDRGIPDLGARIGLHTGRVVAGNLGSARRMKYAVIGDTVNVAARCEALNKELGTDILLTDAVRAALPADVAALAVSRGSHRVKGREQAVEVYSV
jgi:adenylate cyclase